MHRLFWSGAAALLVAAPWGASRAGAIPFLPSVAASTPSVVDADSGPLTVETLNTRLKDLRRQLDQANEEAGTSTYLARKRFLLQWQVNTLREHVALLQAIEIEKSALDSIAPEDAASGAASSNKSWRLDYLRAELQWRSDEVKKRETDIRLLTQLIEGAQLRADDEGKSRRLVEDRLSGRVTPDEQAQLLRERSLSLLSQQCWRAQSDLSGAKQKVQQQRLQEARKALQDTETLLQKQTDDHVISADELAQILRVNDGRRAQLEQQISEQALSADALRDRLAKLAEQDQADERKRTQLNDERDALEHRANNARELERISREIERLGSIQPERQSARKQILLEARTSQIALDMLGMMLNALALERSFWERRASSASAISDLSSDKFATAIAQFDIYEKLVRGNLDLVQAQLARAMLQADFGTGPLVAVAFAQPDDSPIASEFRKRQQYYIDTLSALVQIRRMLERRMSDFDVHAHTLTGSARVDYVRTEVLDRAQDVWHYELFNVDDTMEVDGQTLTVKRGVTVGKVIAAILLVTLGGWLASRTMRVLERFAIARAGMQPVTAHIARRWLFVLVMLGLIIWSLTLVRIPLTAFAFLGGAVAIGVGFGTQNLLKNLISGLMIMSERPMRPGDWIEVGSLSGEVTDINLRATIIRDVNGIETLIPNSTFVEQSVTNWTLSNRMIRRGIKVGVAYDSPTRKVAELLTTVARSHPQVTQAPEPEVVFEDFGASALQFSLYFWLEMRPDISSRKVFSELRYAIAESFAANGIVMAFPQQDVHLDSSHPLVVRLDQAPPKPPCG